MNYDIELNANDSSVLETQYAFTQGDYGQIQFSIRVKANGAYVTNAQRAYIVFTLPNGYVVTGDDMVKSVATYTYPFQGNELQVPGVIIAEVKLVYTDGQISSNKFSFICRYDPLNDKSFNAGPYISHFQQVSDYLQSLIAILQADVGGTPVMRNDLHNTRDAVAAELKAIDANMAQYMLIKSDLVNDALTTVAGVSPLDAAMGKTLQDQIDTTNSNLTDTNATVAKYNIKYHYRGVIGASTILNNVSDLIALGFYGGDLSLNGSYVPPDTYNNNSYGTVHWILGTGDIAYLQFIRDRDASVITRSISRSESFDTGWIVH